MRLLDLTGQRFGMLTAERIDGHNSNGRVMWFCRCDCGRTKSVARGNLRTGNSGSCGCRNREQAIAMGRASRTHGMTGAPELRAYTSAKSRCRGVTSHDYPNYGGRGIEFRFESFEQWMECLGPRPSAGFSVDRIDNDGHYEPGNVRWADKRTQANNRRCACPNCGLIQGHA